MAYSLVKNSKIKGSRNNQNFISRRKFGVVYICIALIGVLTTVNAQQTYQGNSYEGFAHYINYDDYEDESTRMVRNPYTSIHGSEKVWNEEMMYIPELILEDPRARNDTSPFPLNLSPCGDTSTGPVYYSAYPGRSNLIRWKVVHPIVDGNCTIRLSNGVDDQNEKSFEVLKPVYDFSYQNEDGTFDFYSGEQKNYYRQQYDRGKFACGRVDPGTFESITVSFPNMTWDGCTFQLIVETKEGKIYQCADIEVINSNMGECKGTCLNEGQWVNGKCICRSGYLGDHWQNKTQEKKTYTSWFVIIGLILLTIVVIVVCYISLQFVSQKESWITKFGRPRKSKRYPDAAMAL